MKKELASDIKKNLEKSTEYPIIYTYIYEREMQDLDRLYKVFENKTKSDTFLKEKDKVIVKYEIDANGKLIPVYKTTE